MNGFVIRKLNNEKYDKILVCLTFESIVNYLNDIEESSEINGQSGLLLIDQLLVTGNGRNRFICCEFSNGVVNINSTHDTDPSESIRKESVKILKENMGLLRHSILTDEQRESIVAGHVF